jgi:two-component system chemotaxis sensor kinase CheA
MDREDDGPMDAELIAEFLVESHEHLDRVDRELAALGCGAAPSELLAGIFRTVHTIKGTAGFLGFGRIGELSHAGEALLGRLRDGDVPLGPTTTGSLLALVDGTRSMLDAIEADGDDRGVDRRRLVGRLHECADVGRAGVRRGDPTADTRTDPPRVLTADLTTHPTPPRMLPIEHVWSRFPRLVRELAVTCGKWVRLEAEGGDIELEATVLAALRDPLTHIVRNSVDHGVESPADRVAAGKPREGAIRLRAASAGDEVVVEVADDGAGLDLDRVRAAAVRRGLLRRDQAERLCDRDVAALVFSHGLSTATTVTSVSGRGVGMDVVRTDVERVGGTVELRSEPGTGTTLTVRLPVAPAAATLSPT